MLHNRLTGLTVKILIIYAHTVLFNKKDVDVKVIMLHNFTNPLCFYNTCKRNNWGKYWADN